MSGAAPDVDVRAAHPFRAALSSPSFIAGAALTVVVVAAALLSLVWTPHDAEAIVIARKLSAPSADHWLGTDQFGRDVFSQLMIGARASLMVAVAAVGVGLTLGAAMGALAAARGGWLDETVMRANDLIFAFPALLTAVMLAAVYRPAAWNAVVAVGVYNAPVFARLTRGAALSLWRRDFVLAARTAGKTPLAITLEHIAPNLASVLIVQATIQFAIGVLAEAALSYVGLGVQPPTPSWGRMLADAQVLIYSAPQLAIWPGVAIMGTVLGLNLMGDGLRDALDPRVRRAR